MDLLCAFLTVYLVVLFGRAVVSWFPIRPGTPLASLAGLLTDLTEPVLRPVRGLMPPARFGGVGLDLSFLVVAFGVMILQRGICG